VSSPSFDGLFLANRFQVPMTMIQPAPPPPRRLNMAVVVILVVATAFAVVPTFRQHQTQSTEPPIEKRAWQMPDVIGKTQNDLIGRFGPPLSTKDYSLQEGSFAGPEIGLKHYYLLRDPAYAARLKDASTRWTFPKYTTIRELIWRLPDSYLTVWLQEPRAEANFEGDNVNLTLPSTAPGEWVALDDYRIGKDLLAKAPPVR
jgi:hypothetical protein